MKGIYNLLFFLVFSNCLFAQKRIVNLLSALEQAKNDSQKIEAYKQLIIHYSAQKPDSADWYANEGIKYSIDKGYKVGEAKIVAQQAVLDENQGRPNKGKERDEYALKIYREQNDLKGVALTIHNLGAIEAGQGNFDIAIKYFVSALKVYDSITDYHGLMLTYMNMGNLYIEHQDTTNAWKYMSLAVQAGKNAPISEATIFLYNIIGVMYAGKGMQDTALKIFLNDLELSDKPGFVNSRAECILYLGEFYSEKGDNGQAVKYLENGLGISIENNLPEMEANFLEGIAKLQEKAHPDSAMNYLNKAKVLCENTHNKMFLANIYGEIASLYKQQGNYKEALTATEQKQKITDSVFNINKAREIANIGDAYEMEKSKMRVNQLEILSNSNAKERNVIFIIAACIIIVLVVLLIYYRKTTLLNRQLVKSKQELK
jgi:tetratricopeptide (TPR) repeat protein